MKNRLITDFYELTVKQLMDRRLWDLPILEEASDIHVVLNILSARNHIWVVNNKTERELTGVITEHDALTILTPKRFSPYVFGLPDIRSLQYGTVKTAGDIMMTKLITCSPEDKIITILQRMAKYQLRRLPVVNRKTLIGEITLNQLIQKYYDATQYHAITDNEEG
ncbi:MAG: CBS domain-containing protein [Methanobacteriota archaeon]